MPLRNTSILIVYSYDDFSKAPVVLYPDESEFKIFQYIFDINFHFQAREYWRDSTTNATPKFTIHAQRFWWVKCGFSEAIGITSGSWLRWGNVVSNLKELYLSIYTWEQQIQSTDSMVPNQPFYVSTIGRLLSVIRKSFIFYPGSFSKIRNN